MKVQDVAFLGGQKHSCGIWSQFARSEKKDPDSIRMNEINKLDKHS